MGLDSQLGGLENMDEFHYCLMYVTVKIHLLEKEKVFRGFWSPGMRC
jgi:hypothetical protein